MEGQDLLQYRDPERLDANRSCVTPVERFRIVLENPAHQPIHAATDNQIDPSVLLRIIPEIRHCAEYRGIDSVKLLELVNDQRDRTFFRGLQDNAEYLLKLTDLTEHGNIQQILDLTLKAHAKVLFGFARNIEVEIRLIRKCTLDELGLSNTTTPRNDSESRTRMRFITNFANMCNLFLSIKELHLFNRR